MVHLGATVLSAVPPARSMIQKERMRILFASHSRKDPHGGASRVYHLLEDGLKGRGHLVKTLHFEDMGIAGKKGRIAERLRLPQAISSRVAREHLEEWDVIMSSSGMLYPLFEKLRGHQKRPLLVNHLHGLAYFDHQATMSEAERGNHRISAIYRFVTGQLPVQWDLKAVDAADLTIVQNGRDEDFLRQRGTQALVNIPLCVQPEILEAGYAAPAAAERRAASLLWFGSWVARKGKSYLPSAFGQIAARHPEATLTIGGTGIAAETLLSHFAPELRSKIRVLPRVSAEEQLEIYRSHSIFLFPSLSEGFGFALLEAMSMGLAAVTTDTGLAGDFLVDRQHAVVTPKASALHLARGVVSLIEDQALRTSIAAQGQKLARQFTVEKMIDGYEKAFQQALAARR